MEIGGNIHMRISFTQPATLHVEVKQADDLVVSIKNKTCNPYAVVTLLGEYEVFKTQVDANFFCDNLIQLLVNYESDQKIFKLVKCRSILVY